MKTIDNSGVTFVNLVLGRGVLNSVVNVQFGTWLFGGKEDGSVDPEPTVSCRLRMDVACAESLRDALTELLQQIKTPADSVAVESGASLNGAAKH
jgi:hypothetical protein